MRNFLLARDFYLISKGYFYSVFHVEVGFSDSFKNKSHINYPFDCNEKLRTLCKIIRDTYFTFPRQGCSWSVVYAVRYN